MTSTFSMRDNRRLFSVFLNSEFRLQQNFFRLNCLPRSFKTSSDFGGLFTVFTERFSLKQNLTIHQ